MDDLNDIMAVIAEARSYMALLGNPQWSDGFPSESYIADKIDRRLMYVVRCFGEVTGVFSVTGDEPDYGEIDGEWLNDGAYLAVHTVAVGARFRGMGVAKFIFANAFAMAEEGGMASVRVDTHQRNAPMRALLSSLGFVCCGGLTVRGGFLAYERPVATRSGRQ